MAAGSTVKVEDQDIFYRETGKELSCAEGEVVLLHGMRFSSANWEEIKTLEKLEQWNYRAVAIDLPGYGNSKDVAIPKQKAVFLGDVCQALNIKKPIIISPSMSGEYSVPFIHDFGKHAAAYIPIAPVATEKFTIQQYRAVKTPTFIVYGENDSTPHAGTSLNLLKNIPGSKEMKMENAGHACYLDQPDKWHEYLHDILISIK